MASPIRLWRTMSPRDPDETHRASTSLELFVDLTFVVAIAQCGASLHHALSEGHEADAVQAFPMLFFAIWWAWMNFTWFASAFDTDDVAYRILTFVQVAGALVLAAGVPRAFEQSDLAVVTLGYCIMRVALVAQWLRASRHSAMRQVGHRYALGIVLIQLGWIGRLALPDSLLVPGFAILVVLELAVPVWAERNEVTTWHPGHIVERYGLFTIIVLGESILAATLALQTALDSGDSIADLATVAAGGFLIVCAMWWLYFEQPTEAAAHSARDRFGSSSHYAFVWGYGHYFVFASAAAVGAGLSTAVDHTAHHSDLSSTAAGMVIAVPVAVFLISTWALHVRHEQPSVLRWIALPVAAAAVLAAGTTPEPTLTIGVILVLLVAVAHAHAVTLARRADRSMPAGDLAGASSA